MSPSKAKLAELRELLPRLRDEYPDDPNIAQLCDLFAPQKRGPKPTHLPYDRGRLVQRLMEEGYKRREAIDRVADEFGVTYSTVETNHKEFRSLWRKVWDTVNRSHLRPGYIPEQLEKIRAMDEERQRLIAELESQPGQKEEGGDNSA